MDKEEKLKYMWCMYSDALYLSKPYEMQYIEMEEFVRWNLPEEIGLKWADDAEGIINTIKYESILPTEVISILSEIRQNFLEAFKLDEASYKEIWTHEAMKMHPFWTGQRKLAKSAAESIGNILFEMSMIRTATPKDAKAIAGIYNYYVKNTNVTFEEQPVTEREMRRRIKAKLSKYVFLVLEEGGDILGYAYADDWKTRCAYKYTVESSVYLKHGQSGRGIGTKLYKELLRLLKDKGIHIVLAGIAIPNDASIALHEKLGFEKTGQLKEVGFKAGRWIDVGYWQYTLK